MSQPRVFYWQHPFLSVSYRSSPFRNPPSIVVSDGCDANTPVHCYVNITCPSGQHQRSIVTFRHRAIAAMFCIPCAAAWTESTEREELRVLTVESNVRG